jgi:hypothetical protein
LALVHFGTHQHVATSHRLHRHRIALHQPILSSTSFIINRLHHHTPPPVASFQVVSFTSFLHPTYTDITQTCLIPFDSPSCTHLPLPCQHHQSFFNPICSSQVDRVVLQDEDRLGVLRLNQSGARIPEECPSSFKTATSTTAAWVQRMVFGLQGSGSCAALTKGARQLRPVSCHLGVSVKGGPGNGGGC